MKQLKKKSLSWLVALLLLCVPFGVSAQVIVPEPHAAPSEWGSLPVPEDLQRKTGTLLEGLTHTWYEYIPSSYTGEQPVPLVVSLHGASGTGVAQATSTGWHLVAEREGFIVIFPNSTVNIDTPDMTNRWDTLMDGNDMAYLKALIEYAMEEYNIDKSRVYMHGVSNGDMMSLQFAIKHGDMLAGLASSIGPTHPKNFELGNIYKPENPLPVYQWRGEMDIIVLAPPRDISEDADVRDEINEFNKRLWIDVNGNELVPEIRIRGKDNTEIYRGGNALFIYNEVKDAPHQTELYAADTMWSEFLSGYSRGADGEIVAGDPLVPAEGDRNAVAIALGANKALIDNEVVELEQGGPVLIGGTMYVPVQFLGQAFGARVELGADGKTAVVTQDNGTVIAFSYGNKAITVNNRVFEMTSQADMVDDQLVIPLRYVAEQLFDKHVSYNVGTVYLSDHYAELSRGTAKVIANMLK